MANLYITSSASLILHHSLLRASRPRKSSRCVPVTLLPGTWSAERSITGRMRQARRDHIGKIPLQLRRAVGPHAVSILLANLIGVKQSRVFRDCPSLPRSSDYRLEQDSAETNIR